MLSSSPDPLSDPKLDGHHHSRLYVGSGTKDKQPLSEHEDESDEDETEEPVEIEDEFWDLNDDRNKEYIPQEEEASEDEDDEGSDEVGDDEFDEVDERPEVQDEDSEDEWWREDMDDTEEGGEDSSSDEGLCGTLSVDDDLHQPYYAEKILKWVARRVEPLMRRHELRLVSLSEIS
jgi:hypothetical protein